MKLERSRTASTVQAAFFTAYRKQDGSYGKINPYRGNLYAMATAPQAYLLPVDKAIIASMLTLSSQTGTGSALLGEAGAELLPGFGFMRVDDAAGGEEAP